MTFPISWPKDCPPADADPASGVVFRIIKANPPAADDFRSFLELGKPNTAKPCDAAGLSAFRELDDAKHYAQKFPHLGEMVAMGTLRAEHGMIKSTPRIVAGKTNSHATWWPYEAIARHELFAVVDI